MDNSKKHYNYLRIYANIGKKEYTETEKEILVKTFIQLSEEIQIPKNLRYDISGEGYGISKGSPPIMLKTLLARIDKKGYKKLDGIGAYHKEYYPYRSQFNLWLQEHSFYRFDADFFWENHGDFDHDTATKIIKTLSEIVEINYAYGFIADETLSSGEWIRQIYEGGSSTSSYPDEMREWEEKIGEIPNGTYRKLFDFNVFNANQVKNLPKNISAEKEILQNGLQIWRSTEKM